MKKFRCLNLTFFGTRRLSEDPCHGLDVDTPLIYNQGILSVRIQRGMLLYVDCLR